MGCDNSREKKAKTEDKTEPCLVVTAAPSMSVESSDLKSIEKVDASPVKTRLPRVPRVRTTFSEKTGSSYWVVEGVSRMVVKSGRLYKSPAISIAGYEWIVWLFPGGHELEKNSEDVAIFVSCSHACSARGQITIHSVYEPSFLPHDFTANHGNMNGFLHWIPRSKLMDPNHCYVVHDSLTIGLTISVIQETAVVATPNKSHPSAA